MRIRFFYTTAFFLILACKPDMNVRQMFYGTGSPPAVSITVGLVETVKPSSKGPLSSPSIMAPDQLAAVKTVQILKGEGFGGRFKLAFESQRNSPPVPDQTYVFFWNQAGACIIYYPVKARFYIKDGRELPLEGLKTRPSSN